MEPPSSHVSACGDQASDHYRVLAGNRNTDGSFNDRGTNANLWSSSESGSNAWRRNLNSGNATVNRNTNDKANGFSVRCLKDMSENATGVPHRWRFS